MRPALVLGLGLLATAGCKKSPTDPGPPPPPPPTVQSIAVTPETATLTALGATTSLSAEVRLSNGTTGTQTPTWSTSSASVATVSGGTVTAVGNGEATITASVGSVSGTARVTVAQAVASVRLLPADTVIKGPAQLRGAALDSRDNPVAGAVLQWQAVTPAITGVSNTGALTPQSTGVARVRVSSGSFTATAIVRTVWNVNVLSDLFPLFEYPASNGQRRAISDVSQAHADPRAAAMGPVWTYLNSLLPNSGTTQTDLYYTSWPEIYTEFNRFCGGVLLPNQLAWQTCTTPFRQHFFVTAQQVDFETINRALARQFLNASHAASGQFPWFSEGYSQWLAGGTAVAAGITGKARVVSINDFRTGDTQNLLAPLDTLMRLPAARYFENLPQRTPVAVRMAQGVMLVSYLVNESQSSVACEIFRAIRDEPGTAVTNDELIALITTQTGKTVAQLETAYLAHARALASGTPAVAAVIPVACSS